MMKQHKKAVRKPSPLAESLNESAARVKQIEEKIDRLSNRYDALLLAIARTFKINLPETEPKRIRVGACYWIATDIFESPVALPVEVKAISVDSISIAPLVGDAKMWKQTATPDELFLTRNEALFSKTDR